MHKFDCDSIFYELKEKRMKKNESKTAKLNSNFTGMMAVVMLSVLFLVIGVVMYLYPDMEMRNFTYVISGFFLVGGAWEVCRYFLKDGHILYRRT